MYVKDSILIMLMINC